MAGSGWSLSPDAVQRFYLPSPSGKTELEGTTAASSVILLVEDSPGDVQLVREALEEHGVGCELIVISNGERAINFIQAMHGEHTRCPDLIILDLNLPRKPGRDVLTSIRENRKCAHVPIVVMTSSDNEQDKYDASSLGASLFLQKPSRLAAFLQLGGIFKQMIRKHEL